MEEIVLVDEQIWENEDYVIKIEKFELDFRAIVFRKYDGELKFITIDSRRENKIRKMLKELNVKLTSKCLRLRG